MSTIAQQIDEITADVIRRAFEAGRKEAAEELSNASCVAAQLQCERDRNAQLKRDLLAARAVTFGLALIFFAVLVWVKK